MVARLLAVACTTLCFATTRAGAQAVPRTARPPAPDIILSGGKVFTADTARPWAEALAITGERIVAIGTTAEVRRLAGRSTREVALGGRVVIPGINDAHDHLGDARPGVAFRTSAAPTPDPTLAQVLDSVRALAARTPAGTWIQTTIGLRVLDDTAARRGALDRAGPSHPVHLGTGWGHGAVLNTAALRALGIGEAAADPLGGWYERDAAGRLTGRLDEYAQWGALRRLHSTLPERAVVAGLRAFADSSVRLGVTTVQDMAAYVDPPRTLGAFRAARLPIRVRLIRWSIPTAAGRNEAEWVVRDTHPAPRTVVSGRKWVVDGKPVERLALMRAPYADRPGWYGRLDFPPDTLRAMLAAALRPGAPQIHLHVVGDSTTALVLAQMAALAPDSVWRQRRVRFEHGDWVAGDLLPLARRLGVVVVQSPSHWADRAVVRARLGDRAERMFAVRSLLAAGVPLAIGSDGPRNPFLNVLFATVGPANRAEALTREQAITAYTRGSAYAEFAEREKGTLAPGMLADLAVLSQDVFTVPAAALPATRSVLTMVGGRVVHDAGTLGAAPTAGERGR